MVTLNDKECEAIQGGLNITLPPIGINVFTPLMLALGIAGIDSTADATATQTNESSMTNMMHLASLHGIPTLPGI